MNALLITLIIILLIIGFFLFFWPYFSNSYEQKEINFAQNGYKLAFIFDEQSLTYKVHGLWIDECNNFCDKNMYTIPEDKTNFIKNKWFNGNLSFFKYEYDKHGSCFGISTTEYLNLVIKLYNKYYDKIKNYKGYKELFVLLDKNFNLVRIIKRK